MSFTNDATKLAIVAGGAGTVLVTFLGFAVVQAVPRFSVRALPPLVPSVAPGVAVRISSHVKLARLFDRAGYDPARLKPGGLVPPILVESLPATKDARATPSHKRQFVRAILPIVLRVNRTLERQRATLLEMRSRIDRGGMLTGGERAWLRRLAMLYRTKPGDWVTLRHRVGPVPPSLVIAQAAAESGWGSSRFALDGNALFGQWTLDSDAGLTPRARDVDKTHSVRAFDRLIDSVWHYMLNLNRHPAYRNFRRLRLAGRRSGYDLAAGLEPYSEKGAAYVTLIRSIIEQNRLGRFDSLKLADRPPPWL